MPHLSEHVKQVLRAFVAVLALSSAALAQSVSGSITGTVQDPTGLPVSDAKVTLVNAVTATQRETQSDVRGVFAFGLVPPGEYRVSVSSPGFKALVKEGIILTASEIRSIGALDLEVGAVSEAVTVKAEPVAVQTASGERGAVVTSLQVENLAIKGRNPLSLLKLQPGVIDTNAESDVPTRTYNGLSVLGNRTNANEVMLDGMLLNQISNGFSIIVSVSQDALSEVKILTSNYQAEFGRQSGGNINMVTKSGTKDFHGLASWFKRHEQFNANSFFNNLNNVPKARYRYNMWNYSLGGPIYIPGKLNRNRDKLFFYWTHEVWPLTIAQPLSTLTMPTAAERAGDFSQTVVGNNQTVVVKDPTTGLAFPNNIVPASRIDPSGQALLKFYPLPNFTNRAISGGSYNYVYQAPRDQPQHTMTLKTDYNLSSKDTLSGTMTFWRSENNGSLANWPQKFDVSARIGKVVSVRELHIFSPKMVNEFNVGVLRGPEVDDLRPQDIVSNSRQAVGWKIPQLYPAGNPLNFIPNATFGGGGLTNPPPLSNFNPAVNLGVTYTVGDNLSMRVGPHNLKFGFYAESDRRSQIYANGFNGTFDFTQNSVNPLDSGNTYANALLGVFNSYTEATNTVRVRLRSSNVEWYAQDNWKVSRRLTLDYGIRFQMVNPLYDVNNWNSAFDPSRFNTSQKVSLIDPVLVNGARMGRDPVTGQVYPAALIGAIAPNSGNLYNGLITPYPGAPGYDPKVPRSLYQGRGPQIAPRFGFAYDPFGKGDTAIRGGFGIFYNRPDQLATLFAFTNQAPLIENPIVYYGTLSTLGSLGGYRFPQNVNGIAPGGEIPMTMNYSLSVQRNLGRSVILDVGYVGALSRHLLWSRNLNAVPFGTDFNAASNDPSRPGNPLPSAFLRPRIGYGDILYAEPSGTENYNSLQVSANRRFTQNLEFGGAWTWSKALDYVSGDRTAVSNLVPVRVWNYGLSSFDRTHVLKIYGVWDVPALKPPSSVLRYVTDHWQVAPIYTAQSGAPLAIGFGTSPTIDITGSPTDGARVVLTGNPNLPKGERTFYQYFRTGVVQLPARGTIGNASRTPLRGPGINNWDMAILKNFPIHEQIRLQFRWELYNAFNHTQFTSVNTTATFNAAAQQIDAAFGRYTAAGSPRVMQLALRFFF